MYLSIPKLQRLHGKGQVISLHTAPGMWLLLHAGIEVNHVIKRALEELPDDFSSIGTIKQLPQDQVATQKNKG